MKKLLINNKIVTVYDSIDEMPIINFQKYNKYLLIDAGIGSDVDSIDEHIVHIGKYIKSGDKAKAMQELQNMRQNMYMINSEISPKYLAFAALIHSIDGKKLTDLSDSNLKRVLEDLQHVKHSSLIEWLMKLKKKVMTELELYFPEDFISAADKTTYDKLVQRVSLILDSIIRDNDNTEAVAEIDDYLFSLYKPKSFIGTESVEISLDKNFESMCLLISQKVNADASKMTVLQFYNAISVIRKQLEAEEKSVKRNKK